MYPKSSYFTSCNMRDKIEKIKIYFQGYPGISGVSLVFRMTCSSSILTITLISLDKMLSIALPFSYNIYRSCQVLTKYFSHRLYDD